MDTFDLSDGRSIHVDDSPKRDCVQVYLGDSFKRGTQMRWGTYRKACIQHEEKKRRDTTNQPLGDVLAEKAGLI